MNTAAVLGFAPSTDSQIETGAVGAGGPASGTASLAENGRPQKFQVVLDNQQDEVKVQIEPPGEIPVYQFVNQQGTLILQVPSEQMLSLARQIAQELAAETAPKTPIR